MKSGIQMLAESPGSGPAVQRQHIYFMRIKMWLNKGDAVSWDMPWGLIDRARLEDNGETLLTDLRIDRESLINGLFYGIEGMKVGGKRKLKLSPHLAYGEKGVAGIVPENAALVVEIEILEERSPTV